MALAAGGTLGERRQFSFPDKAQLIALPGGAASSAKIVDRIPVGAPADFRI